MKRTAILQSSYIPWTGYFAIIGLVDEFILYDDVQYTKGDWRNGLRGDRNERLIGICRQLDSTEYLTGPSARAYLDEQKFSAAGISLCWMDYSEFPGYKQLSPPFVHEVTILDLLLNEGIEGARSYMRKVLSRCEETIFDSDRPSAISFL